MFHSLTMVTAQFSNFIIRINWSASNNNSCAEYIRRIGLATRIMKRLEHVWSQTNLSTSNQHIFHLHVGGTPPRLGNLDPYPTGLEAIGVVPHEVSAADPPHPTARLRTQQRSSASYWSVGSFFHRSQTMSRTVRSCCQACWRCTSKSDPSDLLRSTRLCLTMFRLEACPKSTSYHLDSPDLPRHGSYGDRRPAAGRRPIVLATNCNGGKYGWTLCVQEW